MVFQWDFSGAEQQFQRAIDLNPSYPYAHQWYAEVLWATGRYEESLKEIREALELEPFTPVLNFGLGISLMFGKHISEAEQVYRSDLGLDGKLSRACQHPDNLWSLHGLHECLVRRGEKVETALIKQRLDLAQARAENPIRASCFCRRMDMAAA